MTYAITIETTPEARHWRCEGWTVTTWKDGSIDIIDPTEGELGVITEVDAYPDALRVLGSEQGPYHDAPMRVTIPLPVLRELVRLMEMQAERHLRALAGEKP